ncbi:MAG: gamma-glutamyl-gamma-aminobutyrate hydrolase family protein [Acidobacteriota bacterium]
MRLEIETRRFYLGRDYSEAIQGLGGSPVHIALIPDRQYISSLLSGLDGVLLPGSDSDVDPALYGEDPHPRLKRVVPEKDETERLVIEEAEKLDLPIFAICYGMQALNVSRGGTLVQDIESGIDGAINHEQGLPLARASHKLKFAESGFAPNCAAGVGSKGEAKVNSHHHQAIGRVGDGLNAVAWASDGIVECIEDMRDGRFILGVQWHPELSWSVDPLSRALFTSFLEACGERSVTAV